MEQSQKAALLEAIMQHGTLNKACAALNLDRRAVSRVRQDDGTFNAQVLAAVATARHEHRERQGDEDDAGDPEDNDGASGEGAPVVASVREGGASVTLDDPHTLQISPEPVPIVTPKVDYALPNQSLINVPPQREPLPGHERAESYPGGLPLLGEEPKPVVPLAYHTREAQRVGLPPGAPPISGEEPKVQDERGAASPPPFTLPVGPAYVPPRHEVVAPAPPADLYPPQGALRAFPPALTEALWRFIDAVRVDPTYARNLQVRCAMFEGGDARPMGDLIRAMMEA